MTHSEMIYKSVYQQCIDIGCRELHARDTANIALKKFKDGNHQKPSKLIIDAVASARRIKQKAVR